jgi:hypothetical protein
MEMCVKMNRIALAFAVLLLVAIGVMSAPSHSQQVFVLPPYPGQGEYVHGITWNGSVDDTVDVYIQGGRVWEQVVSGKDLQRVDVRIFDTLPSDHVGVALVDVEGRGTVSVMQQPHRENDYTAMIQINDPQPGRSHYHFRVIW